MTVRKSLITTSLIVAYAGLALGAVSSEKAAQLGKNLTLVGAEKAGNKEGTIPEYTGGIAKPPANYKSGSGWRPDPFESEKPLYSISAKNMDKYNDKLSEGIKAMLKKYPTFRLDIYKTHRTAAFPKFVTDNTVKHALTAKTSNGGLSLTGAHAGFPFPIPNDGYEAMWNYLLLYNGHTYEERYRCYTVDSAGRTTLQAEGEVSQGFPYYDPKKPDTKDFYALKVYFVGPARRVGESFLLIDPIDSYANKRRAWQYLPGQRRVKLAPDISFDTPSSAYGGAATWDDMFLFSGSMERYNFKLIGKKEMYVPFNNYKMLYWTNHEKDALKAHHLNPDVVRWELHRVWVVEATLKPGKRHLYHKQVFYLEEDSWAANLADKYDGRGQLYRVGLNYMTPSYDVPAPYQNNFSIHDLLTGGYVINALPAPNSKGILYHDYELPEKEWTADSLSGVGIR